MITSILRIQCALNFFLNWISIHYGRSQIFELSSQPMDLSNFKTQFCHFLRENEFKTSVFRNMRNHFMDYNWLCQRYILASKYSNVNNMKSTSQELVRWYINVYIWVYRVERVNGAAQYRKENGISAGVFINLITKLCMTILSANLPMLYHWRECNECCMTLIVIRSILVTVFNTGGIYTIKNCMTLYTFKHKVGSSLLYDLL
jgi:hypothetical protein